MLIIQFAILALSLYLCFCDYKSLSIPLWAFAVCGLLCVGVGLYKHVIDPVNDVKLIFFILLGLSTFVYLISKVFKTQLAQLTDLVALPLVSPWIVLEHIPLLLTLIGVTCLLSHVVFKKRQVAFITHLVLNVLLISAWNVFSSSIMIYYPSFMQR